MDGMWPKLVLTTQEREWKNPVSESVATLPPFSPIEGRKWFDQISSQWESQKNRFALIYFGKIQFLPPCIWNLPFMSTASGLSCMATWWACYRRPQCSQWPRAPAWNNCRRSGGSPPAPAVIPKTGGQSESWRPGWSGRGSSGRRPGTWRGGRWWRRPGGSPERAGPRGRGPAPPTPSARTPVRTAARGRRSGLGW